MTVDDLVALVRERDELREKLRISEHNTEKALNSTDAGVYQSASGTLIEVQDTSYGTKLARFIAPFRAIRSSLSSSDAGAKS